MTPELAVVGQPNKGKSSIVATLAEDEMIAISENPGTTRRASRHVFTIDGRALYALVDTPGFQRARAVLAWLREHETGAHERAGVVAAFVDTHRNDPGFNDECELLSPLVEGAGILYVVDGAKPYGPEYEVEMEVLRWTGRPRMALINMIGSGDFADEWRQALDQYFSIVRVFDAVRADFDKRTELLRAFAELEQDWRPALLESVAALEAEHARRIRRSAQTIAGALTDAMTAVETSRLEGTDQDQLTQRLERRLRDGLRKREASMRIDIQALYRHPKLAVEAVDSSNAALDLFTEANWELFGLSRRELVVAAAISGAVAGGAIDLVVGGASLLLGAGIGAAVATTGALFGANELAKVKVLGTEIGGEVLQVGPVKDANFPWVWLGRAWLHHRLVSERNHARREAITIAASESEHLVEAIPSALRHELARLIERAKKSDAVASQLTDAIAQALQIDLDESIS